MDLSIKIYNRLFLFFYDYLVIGLLGRYVWKCENSHYLKIYKTNTSQNHADFGPGTGYFLDHCGLDTKNQKLTLIDINESCLKFAAKRLERFTPKTYICDILKKPNQDLGFFDSISIGGVLHCLPGTPDEKCQVFDHLKSISNPNALIFGYTLMQEDNNSDYRSRNILRFLNWAGIIKNNNDRTDILREQLEKRFDFFEITPRGCMIFFVAHNRKA